MTTTRRTVIAVLGRLVRLDYLGATGEHLDAMLIEGGDDLCLAGVTDRTATL